MATRFSKVIVVGLDGLEPSLARPLMDAGRLPNLAKLASHGGFSSVATTAPAQTPVAWSSFATGTNPGGHGIFDFLGRDPVACVPDLALNRYERSGALGLPKVVNRRRGRPLWDVLTAAGIESSIVRCPCTYPPDPVKGTMLSGMGVPDLRGGFGSSTFYTSRPGTTTGEAEQVVVVDRPTHGPILAHVVGPRSQKDRSDLKAEIAIEVDPVGRKVVVKSSGTPAALEVREGQWSGWLRLKFKAGLLQTVRGIVRFHLVSVGPDFQLYASPVNFDPAAPAFPISHPATLSLELAEDLGPFHTTGMVEDHAGLSNGRIDESAFLDQCADAWREREAQMVHELERLESGFFYCLFDTPDRAQHVLWRHREPDHPANAAIGPAQAQWANAIDEQYERADRAVGTALEFADDKTLVVALSDHGFGGFRRCVDLNKWLFDQGLLALKAGLRPGRDAGDLLSGVDWERTRAYALGLGGVYLNLQGRESRGTVPPEEARSLAESISRGLTGLVDQETGKVAVRSAPLREEIYWGPCASESPDIVAFFGAGHRVSWESSLGGMAESTFQDNLKAWSGDHVIDPALVPGCLWTSHPWNAEGARLIDLAPTILDALGAAPGPAMEGGSLLS